MVKLLIVDLHFNMGKNWGQNVVYMSNERNYNLSFLLCFLIRFCFFFVPLFNFFAFVCFVTTTYDNFQFQSQQSLSQINVIVPIRLKVKLLQFSSVEVVVSVSCSWDDKTSSASGTFPPMFPETATKGWYWKLFNLINAKCLLKCLYVTDWLFC